MHQSSRVTCGRSVRYPSESLRFPGKRPVTPCVDNRTKIFDSRHEAVEGYVDSLVKPSSFLLMTQQFRSVLEPAVSASARIVQYSAWFHATAWNSALQCCILLLQNLSTLFVEPFVPLAPFHVPDGARGCVVDDQFYCTSEVLQRRHIELTIVWKHWLKILRLC